MVVWTAIKIAAVTHRAAYVHYQLGSAFIRRYVHTPRWQEACTLVFIAFEGEHPNVMHMIAIPNAPQHMYVAIKHMCFSRLVGTISRKCMT